MRNEVHKIVGGIDVTQKAIDDMNRKLVETAAWLQKAHGKKVMNNDRLLAEKWKALGNEGFPFMCCKDCSIV